MPHKIQLCPGCEPLVDQYRKDASTLEKLEHLFQSRTPAFKKTIAYFRNRLDVQVVKIRVVHPTIQAAYSQPVPDQICPHHIIVTKVARDNDGWTPLRMSLFQRLEPSPVQAIVRIGI